MKRLLLFACLLLVLAGCENNTEEFKVFPKSKKVGWRGESFFISIESDTLWSVKTDKDWVTVLNSNGSGNGSAQIVVSECLEAWKCDTSYISVISSTNQTDSVAIIRVGNPYPEKCNASDYPQVTIGTQVWMAENYRCSKYDTQSEAYKEGRYIIPMTSKIYDRTPFYADAADKSNWNSSEFEKELTEEQIPKLGYLYNWAAAVGVAELDYDATPFTGNRQGICPNGWHVPSNAEWQILYYYIYTEQNLSSNQIGKHLKTTSGWYDGGNGTDTYGFAALPAGVALTNNAGLVGYITSYHMSSPSDSECRIDGSYIRELSCMEDELHFDDEGRTTGVSVRCIKN